jgi:hypothetical protein
MDNNNMKIGIAPSGDVGMYSIFISLSSKPFWLSLLPMATSIASMIVSSLITLHYPLLTSSSFSYFLSEALLTDYVASKGYPDSRGNIYAGMS